MNLQAGLGFDACGFGECKKDQILEDPDCSGQISDIQQLEVLQDIQSLKTFCTAICIRLGS